MFLIVNLLIGDIPETLGLLLFGAGLVAITIGLRWVLNENQKEEIAEERVEKLAGKN